MDCMQPTRLLRPWDFPGKNTEVECHCLLHWLALKFVYVEYIVQNAGLDVAQARLKIARRNINNLRYADDTTLMAESEEELKILPVDESEK